jgi:hypothetical protein
MAPYIPYLRRAVLIFLHSKLTYKKGHEIAIVLFGTRGTNNLVHDKALSENPANFSQYTNIVTLHYMHQPTFETIKEVDQAFSKVAESRGGAFPADLDEALIVTWDLIFDAFNKDPKRKEYRTKRIILISNFLSKKKLNDDVGLPTHNDGDVSELHEALTSKLLENNIDVDAISLDIPEDEVDATIQAIKKDTIDYLDRLSTKINMKMRSISYGADLAGVFPVGGEHTVTHTYATADLCLGEKLKIAVKFSLKAQMERTPSLGKESPLIHEHGGGGGGGVASGSKEAEAEGRSSAAPTEGIVEIPGIQRSIEYYRKDDRDQLEPVPPEEMIKGFRVSIKP